MVFADVAKWHDCMKTCIMHNTTAIAIYECVFQLNNYNKEKWAVAIFKKELCKKAGNVTPGLNHCTGVIHPPGV